MLLFNYKINEHLIAVVQFSRLCTTNTQIFFCLKNRADHESALSTNYCFLLVLTLLLFCICSCCSDFCCKMKFFSFSAMYFSAKCKIKSQLFNVSPLSALQKGLAFLSVRLVISYITLIKNQANK